MTDPFGTEGRRLLNARLRELPGHTREAEVQELSALDFLDAQVKSTDQRLETILAVSVETDLLQTLPGVVKLLSLVMMLEIGRVDRFPTAAHLASYAGLVPRVCSSGGHTRLGHICANVNHNLKWAFVEAANAIVLHQRRYAGTHVVRLYKRIKRSKSDVVPTKPLVDKLVKSHSDVMREGLGPRPAQLVANSASI